MGSVDFENHARGATAREAFDAARAEAAYAYGHAGYTGTIAEKGEFVLWTLPEGVTPDEVCSVFAQGYELPDEEGATLKPPPRIATFIRPCVVLTIESISREVPHDADPLSVLKPGEVGRVINNHPGAAVERDHDAPWAVSVVEPHPSRVAAYEAAQKVTAIPGWRRYYDVYTDKWGPALAMKDGENTWLFCGRASC